MTNTLQKPGRRARLTLALAWGLATVAGAQVTNMPQRLAAYGAAVTDVSGAIGAGTYAGFTNRIEVLRAATMDLNDGMRWLASRCRAGLPTTPFAARQEQVFTALENAGDSSIQRDKALFDAVLLDINHYTNHEELVAITLTNLTGALSLSATALAAIQDECNRLTGTTVPSYLTLETRGPHEAAHGELVELVASVRNVGDMTAANVVYRLEEDMNHEQPPLTPAALGDLEAGGTREFSVFLRMPEEGTVAVRTLSVWADATMAASIMYDVKVSTSP